jgi:hypothetical protein
MRNAAHVESLSHEVYQGPFKVEPKIESRETPWNYHDRHLGTDKLPDKMKVWRVQEPQRNNVVSRGYGFLDSPDTEVIAAGFNTGKEYGGVGIGRHGSFLQWGYGASPSQMTEAGRRLFINCIHYIRHFDGQFPLVRRLSSQRLNAMRLARIINRISSSDQKQFFLRTFGEELYDKYGSDPNGLIRYYRENLVWVYRDGVFRVDEELKSLGIESNRQLNSLERLIGLLEDESHAKTALELLRRYTIQSFGSAGQWQKWFAENKDRMFFTDVGGYKFMVAPKQYPVRQDYEGAIGALSPSYGTAGQ